MSHCEGHWTFTCHTSHYSSFYWTYVH